METKEKGTKRTGGRSAQVLVAVRNAVETLVKEKGREQVTVPMIAAEAGVNPTSIYRRWGDLSTLINDLATYKLDPARPLPDTGDLKNDLTLWAREFVEHYRKPVNAAILRGGAAKAGDRESDCLRNRRIEANLFLGRTPSDVISADEILDHIIAPIVYRVIFQPWTIDDATSDKLVERLFSCS